MARKRDKPIVGKAEAEKLVAADSITVEGNLVLGGGVPPVSETRAAAQEGTPHNLPSRNEKFVGRESELAEIHEWLSRQAELGVTQQAAAHGLGGVGKTAVAHEYAWRHLDDYPGGVFVLGCDTDQLLSPIIELTDPLGIEEADTPEKTAARVKSRLEADPPALLILDNVRDAQQWSDAEWSQYIPAGNCRRLITTRSPHLSADVEMYPIERLPRAQGIALLAKYRLDAGEPANEQLVGDLVDWFDGLAVGLTVVGVYMTLHPDLGWADYAASLEKKGLGAVRAAEEHVDREAGGLPDRYEKRVDAVFDETLDALPPEQRRALEYAALLPEDNVLHQWLTWLLERDESLTLPALPGYEGRAGEPVVAAAVELHLLRPARGSEDALSLHRVLRRCLGELLEADDELRNALIDSVAALAKERGKASHDALTDKSLRPELTPLVELSEALRHHGRVNAALSLANCVHTPLEDLGRYAENRSSLMRFVDLETRTPAEIGPAEIAALYSNLAMTLQDLGDLSAARRRMEQAIGIREKHLEPDHPTLATSYSNLATILKDLGDLAGARQRMEQAIGIWEKHFDPDHPTLAISYSNLAAILKDLGDLPGARQRMEQAIAIDEKHFEADHPALAADYNNLATILKDLGDLPNARQRMEQAIAIERKHFEPDHPTLATSYNNLAHIELAEGNERKACELWRRAYRIFTKHFDDDHPSVRNVAASLRRHCGGVPPKT